MYTKTSTDVREKLNIQREPGVSDAAETLEVDRKLSTHKHTCSDKSHIVTTLPTEEIRKVLLDVGCLLSDIRVSFFLHFFASLMCIVYPFHKHGETVSSRCGRGTCNRSCAFPRDCPK
ncbi:hypothetical protein Trydic_g21706 [Trypoxylus dichotomus]